MTWSDGRAGDYDIYAARLLHDGTVSAITYALVDATADPWRVRLCWHGNDADSWAVVWRRTATSEWLNRAHIEADHSGLLVFEDDSVEAGRDYVYRLMSERGDVLSGDVWVHVPQREVLKVEPPRPNPARGTFAIRFTLPTTDPATIELVDVAGRRRGVWSIAAGAIGSHELQVGGGAPLPSGVYWVRLRQGLRTALQRYVITN